MSEPRDPGVQPERTVLAWRRTLLALAVVTLLATRQALYSGAAAGRLLSAGVLLAVWAIAVAVAARRIVLLRTPRPAAPGLSVCVTGLCVVGLALAGAVLVLAGLL